MYILSNDNNNYFTKKYIFKQNKNKFILLFPIDFFILYFKIFSCLIIIFYIVFIKGL
jgi:hypothetical protein